MRGKLHPMGFQFDPTHIQAIGIGIAAFLATTLMVFVFLSARNEKLGRPMWLTLLACAVWGWFGFLYHIVPDIWLAREMRVISVMGIVWISMTEMHFATVYLRERVRTNKVIEAVRWCVFVFGTALTLLLFTDLFGTRFVVGNLSLPPEKVLAPEAGPFMLILVIYYAVSTALAGILLAWRAHAGVDRSDRLQALLLATSMTVGLALGGTRFTPWFGFDFYPLVGGLGFPLFSFAALYSIQRYHLLNVQVAAAQILVFALWTFTFFRALINPSLRAALPDIGLFVTVLILGVFLLRSVVAEIRTQKELARLAVDRMKSEFVTIAAHQLRTPLSAVRWTFSLLLTDSATPLVGAQREIAEKGARAADNMMALSNDLLNVARISNSTFSFELETGDVRDVVTLAVGLLEEPARKRNIQLSARLPDSLPTVEYDRGKLAFALENLIDNAIKYTPKGGHVTVDVRESGGNVIIAVHDTGIGIAPAEQSRLFERFFRGAEAVRMSPDGSGLGLFIAKTIVEGHGGKITISSDGRGTTATITLRASAPAEP